jgi:hypothetical protein
MLGAPTNLAPWPGTDSGDDAQRRESLERPADA